MDPTATRRGIASLLIETIAARAATLGLSAIEVRANSHAAAFYAAAGFAEVGTATTRFATAARLRRVIS